MPTGFRGFQALIYLQAVESALATAKTKHGTNVFAGLIPAVVPFPPLPPRLDETAPSPSSTANTGGHSTSFGSSSNIAVSRNEYDTIFTGITDMDEEMSASLYEIAGAIEDLCDNEFDMPLASQKCKTIALALKNSLGEYQSLTAEALLEMRNFVDEIITAV